MEIINLGNNDCADTYFLHEFKWHRQKQLMGTSVMMDTQNYFP